MKMQPLQTNFLLRFGIDFLKTAQSIASKANKNVMRGESKSRKESKKQLTYHVSATNLSSQETCITNNFIFQKLEEKFQILVCLIYLRLL